MGPCGIKTFKTRLLLQMAAKVFKLFLNFLLTCPDKIMLVISEILKIEILTFFFILFSLTWDPMGVKSSKRYSYKSQPNLSKLTLNFPPNFSHKTTFEIFEILSFGFLTIYF